MRACCVELGHIFKFSILIILAFNLIFTEPPPRLRCSAVLRGRRCVQLCSLQDRGVAWRRRSEGAFRVSSRTVPSAHLESVFVFHRFGVSVE